MVTIEDEESQKKGAVNVIYGVGQKGFSRDSSWKATSLLKAIPVRVEAIHVCHDSLLLSPLVVLAKLATSAFNRFRFRSHYGTYNITLTAFGDGI